MIIKNTPEYRRMMAELCRLRRVAYNKEDWVNHDLYDGMIADLHYIGQSADETIGALEAFQERLPDFPEDWVGRPADDYDDWEDWDEYDEEWDDYDDRAWED